MHVSLDEAQMIPEMIYLTPAKVSDHRGADNFRYPAGTIFVDDRGYFDFGLFATTLKPKTTLRPALSPIPFMNPSSKMSFWMGKMNTC